MAAMSTVMMVADAVDRNSKIRSPGRLTAPAPEARTGAAVLAAPSLVPEAWSALLSRRSLVDMFMRKSLRL